MHARALILPEGCDPDDFIKKYGKGKLDELIALAPAISDYYIDNILGDGKTFEENRDLVKTAMEFVGKIGDETAQLILINSGGSSCCGRRGPDDAACKQECTQQHFILHTHPLYLFGSSTSVVYHSWLIGHLTRTFL